MANMLVVDDDTLVRNYLFQVLTCDGHQVLAVESGEDALACIADREFDVALLDLKMDGVGGMEVLTVLRQQWPDTVVILLTGHPTLETVFGALRQGAFDYLFKPCRIAELRESVSKGLLQRRQLLRQREETSHLLAQDE
ncbi:MAG: response regulator [Anaerolineae bacterium]|jgi:DNA-binding NtrC family response regulator